MEGAPKTHFSAFDDQTMMTKAEKDLPEVKTVLDVVFAGHLQIVLIGEAEFQLVLHPVDLALECVAWNGVLLQCAIRMRGVGGGENR